MRLQALLCSLLGLAATSRAAELNVYHRVLSRDAPAGEFTLRGLVSTSSSAGGPTYASTGSPADALTALARALPASAADAALYQLALAPAGETSPERWPTSSVKAVSTFPRFVPNTHMLPRPGAPAARITTPRLAKSGPVFSTRPQSGAPELGHSG